MTSIYEQALGTTFRELHPKIQERFGFNSQMNVASIGRGVMDEIWFSKWARLPLYIGTIRHIMFPEGGKSIPFTIENYAYQDCYGRETVTWHRRFHFPKRTRVFDATMIYSQQRGRVVDYLGNKQHLAVDLDLSVTSDGGIQIRSGDQRFYEGLLQFHFPSRLTGTAQVCEWYDDQQETYRISVEVLNDIIGTVFKYQGSFQVEYKQVSASELPKVALPQRQEKRE